MTPGMPREAILHIAPREAWAAALEAGVYRGDTLDGEGFIHCSTPDQVLRVADALYRGRRDLVLLVIEPGRVPSEIRYEGEAERFPHVYGPVPVEAVTAVWEFAPGPDGRFALPPALRADPE